jgi:predicted peptidase
MPRVARWAVLALLISACSSSDTTDPLSPQQLWSTAQPSATAGSESIQLYIILARAGDVLYSVYATPQPNLTAAQVREDADGVGGRAPVRSGTTAITQALVEDTVIVLLQGLTPTQAYYVYLAGTPTTADPAPSDVDEVRMVSTVLAERQPAVSLQSTAVSGAVGYYAYLPEDHYLHPNEKFPLLIFLHGSGEKGNGSTELSRVRAHGPPRLIQNGRDLPFIVISPQLPASQGGWPTGLVDELIDKAIVNYHVDTTRMYVTGLSLGGYGAWAYAVAKPGRLAAVVPIAGAGSTGQACNLRGVPAWAFHGDADGTVSVSGSVNMVAAINACAPPPSVLAQLTIYPGVGHDSWTRTYDGTAGHDIYAWMLQYHR